MPMPTLPVLVSMTKTLSVFTVPASFKDLKINFCVLTSSWPMREFAKALEFIPSTLAENAGMDPIDIITELKSRHDSGEKNAGLNLFTNHIEDMLEARIIEPLKIKTQAISSASDVAIMILRIDDVIASTGEKEKKPGYNRMPEID